MNKVATKFLFLAIVIFNGVSVLVRLDIIIVVAFYS
jgi:hypothetical protein